ncbi:MAG TPA: FkbM family methyltransferase, partial [Anaerolineae bacterium]|nr:FkbM family methyltransferase [Anaerolineae bacterium]
SLRRVSPNTINSITVSTTTLDAYFAPLNIGPHVIKLDIEGAELLALRGAEGVLRTFRPILVVEASKELMHAFGYGCGDLIDFLRAVDYHLYTLNYSALKPIPTEYRSGYENLICLPRDSSSYTALTSSGIRPI